MNPHEYKKVKEIFQIAVELPPEKRREFLDENCVDDENLRFQVERLLGNNDSLFLEEPIMAQMAETVVKAEHAEEIAEFLAASASDGYFSHYKIIEKIGQGGMGEVYLADDTRLGRKVAIKFLSREFSRDEERLRRFMQEAKSASALNHPNIITVYETREQSDIYYVVNEFVEGETLSQIIRKRQISTLDAVKIAIQIASALVAAHEAGIIHRDIKPDNVMVRRDEIVKVLDFGLATTNEHSIKDSESFSNVVTTPGMILGTPQYMSPEQAKGQKADNRSDIFSFGILLYELVTGKSPFEGKNQIEILAAILKEKPQPIEEFVADVPDELKRIIDKSLQKEPEKRYQSAKEILADLNELKDELKFESKLSQKIQQTTSDSITKKNDSSVFLDKRFFYLSAVLLLLIASVAAVSVWQFRSGAKQDLSYAGNQFSAREIASWASTPGELFSTGTFSPDGKTIAFSSTRSGKNGIWIKGTNAGDAVQVTKDEFENKYPVFSPNGDEIAFISTRDGENGIWRIPRLGGSAQFVTNFKDAGAILKLWSESGKFYYESERNLFAFDPKTGDAEKLTEFDSEAENFHQIAVSKDEKHLAFVLNQDEKWKIFVKEIGAADASEIATLENEINEIRWHADGKRILYSALKSENFQIFAVGTSGNNNPVQITFGEKDSIVQDVSADGRKILLGSAQENSNLWFADIENSSEKLFSANINSEMWQTVSPDGQTIVYQSIKNLSQANRLLRGAIFSQKISADASPVQIAEDGFLPSFSADGKTVAYLKSVGESAEIRTVKSSGGNPQRLAQGGIETIGFTISPYNPLETASYGWSPVANEIAYIADRGDGANLRLVSSDASRDEQLTDYKDENLLLFSPIWSSDGGKIAYYSVSSESNAGGKAVRAFWIYNRRTKENTKIFETDAIARLIGFSMDERELIYASASKFSSLPPQVALYAVSLETGAKKMLHELKDVYYYNIRLSPDRAQIAFVSRAKKNDDLYIAPAKGGAAEVLTENNDPRTFFSALSWSPDGKKIFFAKQTRFTILSMIDDFE